jgi:ferric-dicitrate binding protein FerR (iron transport regulator)
MKKKDLIIKWLDNNLSEKELKAFKELDASSIYTKMDKAARSFKAPDFDLDAAYSRLKEVRVSSNSSAHWKRYVSGIAAALLLSFGLYFAFLQTSDTQILAQNSEKTEATLPDASEVVLNAGSSISYNEKTWSKNREIELTGEAYFKVAKGSKFTVRTSQGEVSVLGTQFTVNARKNFFEVVCFEGLVQVNYEGVIRELPAGKGLKVYGNKEFDSNTVKLEPTWLQQKSSFTSVPYIEVVQELERQYNTSISFDRGLKETLFTGTFTHANLETALRAVTIPLNLSYTINGNEVVLKSN